MIVLMLQDAGMEAVDLALHNPSFQVLRLKMDAAVTGHQAHQPRHGQAAFPAQFLRIAQGRDLRVHQGGQGHTGLFTLIGRRLLPALGGGPLPFDEIDEQAQRHMDLGRGQAGALRILHGLDHVAHQRTDLRRPRIFDLPGPGCQNRVTHLGDFQYGHGRTMLWGRRRVKPLSERGFCHFFSNCRHW